MEMEGRPRKFESQKKLGQVIMAHWEKSRQAKSSGRLAWVSPLVPMDILNAMGFVCSCSVNHSAVCSMAGVSTELIQISESHGYGSVSELCGYAQTDLGSFLSGEETKSPIKPPKPDLLVATTQCHMIAKWFETLGRLIDAPVVILDLPVIRTGDEETVDSAKRYAKGQLREFVTFLEELTKQKLDYTRLQECVRLSGQQFKLLGDISRMGVHVPSPVSAFDICFNLAPILTLRGTPEGVSYFEELKEEVSERVAQKIGAFPFEKYRLYFYVVPPWFALTKVFKSFIPYGACPVAAFYPLAYDWEDLDPSNPLDTQVDVLYKSSLTQGLEQRIDMLAGLVQEYHIDGIVYGKLGSCKLGPGEVDYLETAANRAGVPLMTFETDMADARLHSETEFNSRLQTFVELLESSKQTASS